MSTQQCPYAEEIGVLRAEIVHLRKQLADLQAIAQANANSRIEEIATKQGYWKGIDIATRIVSAILIAGFLLAAGKFTGAAEFLLKFLRI